MAKTKLKNLAESPIATGEGRALSYSYCSLPKIQRREFNSSVGPARAELIRVSEKKWVNGTVLHYYFFDQSEDGETVFFQDGSSEWRAWTTDDAEKEVVHQAFKMWENVEIGLEFKEVNSRDEAEIRIGFMRGDGAWSYVGRDILGQGQNKRTMNFGWDLTRHPTEIDTAIHEIGHTLGFPHEHQNPHAGIVWDEEAVYASLAGPPNNWSRDQTFHNIIRKIEPDTVQGSNWDPDSIMHYPFDPGMIKQPTEYFVQGLSPKFGLSARDNTWVKTLYPPLNQNDYQELETFKSVELEIEEGAQRNFIFRPTATREYDIRTFGDSDTVMVLFEETEGEPQYLTADDDSGENFNASIQIKLIKGHSYILRIRLYSSHSSGQTAVMIW